MKLHKLGKMDDSHSLEIPFVNAKVKAGFPSPATDYEEERLDLNKKLVKNKEATFYIEVEGHSMKFANIIDGDILVVDRSIQATSNKIVVAYLDGCFTLKRVILLHNKCYLQADNPDFKNIEITEENDFIVWGVVTWIIHKAI